jgi:hypothetical protein
VKSVERKFLEKDLRRWRGGAKLGYGVSLNYLANIEHGISQCYQAKLRPLSLGVCSPTQCILDFDFPLIVDQKLVAMNVSIEGNLQVFI